MPQVVKTASASALNRAKITGDACSMRRIHGRLRGEPPAEALISGKLDGSDQHVNDLPVPVRRTVNVPPDTVDSTYVSSTRHLSPGQRRATGLRRPERQEPPHPPVEVTAHTRHYRVWLWALEVRDMPELSSTRSAY